MDKFEDPTQFDIQKNISGIEIAYSDLMEISQGGPEIGYILINGIPIKSHRFGGPSLNQGDNLYIPIYVKRVLGTGFKIAKINIKTLELELLGKTKTLIFLDRIENNRTCYFEDVDKTIVGYYDL